MSAPSPASFYAPAHMGTAFGVVDKLHPNGHSGQDVNGWAAGTRIPAFAAGKVVRRGSTGNFGNWVSVDIGGGLFAHYCHLENLSTAPVVGTQLEVGSDAGPLGNTGYSKGNHLHGMVSASNNPEAYSGVRDSLPYMIAARGGGGGGGGATPGGKNVSAILKMAENNTLYWVGPNGALLGIPDQATASALGRYLEGERTGAVTLMYYGDMLIVSKYLADSSKIDVDLSEYEAGELSDEEIAAIGASVNLQPVLDAIKAGDETILTAIAKVDEATLATFGLKRA